MSAERSTNATGSEKIEVTRPGWSPRRDRQGRGCGPSCSIAHLHSADAADLGTPFKKGHDRFFKPHLLPGDHVEEMWSIQQIERACRLDGMSEAEARQKALVLYSDQLRHLNKMNNQIRRIARNEDASGLLLYDVEDPADDE